MSHSVCVMAHRIGKPMAWAHARFCAISSRRVRDLKVGPCAPLEFRVAYRLVRLQPGVRRGDPTQGDKFFVAPVAFAVPTWPPPVGLTTASDTRRPPGERARPWCDPTHANAVWRISEILGGCHRRRNRRGRLIAATFGVWACQMASASMAACSRCRLRALRMSRPRPACGRRRLWSRESRDNCSRRRRRGRGRPRDQSLAGFFQVRFASVPLMQGGGLARRRDEEGKLFLRQRTKAAVDFFL